MLACESTFDPLEAQQTIRLYVERRGVGFRLIDKEGCLIKRAEYSKMVCHSLDPVQRAAEEAMLLMNQAAVERLMDACIAREQVALGYRQA